jgi:predicted  nucleic acid-binding Zn-ribbon protein
MDGLKELYHFQEISNRIHEFEERLAALVADPTYSQVLHHLSRVSSELASIDEAISALKKEIGKLEKINGGEQEKCQQCQKKLYDGSIANPKELAQLQQKIDEYREIMNANDERMLQLWEELEQKEEEAIKVKDEQGKLSMDLATLKRNCQEQKDQFKAEIAHLEQEAESLRTMVPEELLQLYTKMASSHHGVAIAPLKGDLCGACHVALTSGILRTLKKSKEGYIRCENCGRIVFIP